VRLRVDEQVRGRVKGVRVTVRFVYMCAGHVYKNAEY